MIPTWVLLDEAAEVAGLLLQETFGVARKRNEIDPLDDHDFEILLKQMFASLVRAAAPEEQRAIQSVQTMLDLNWPGMTATAREEAISQIAKALGGVPKLVIPKVERVLAQQGPQIVAATKREAAASYELPITSNFTIADQKVVDAARTSQAHYIRNEYGKREAIASDRARAIVARGIERGFDRYEIAEQLKPAMDAIGINRSLGYYRMVTSVFAARARSWGVVSSFSEAGITHMEWVSVLDESTSDVCRFLDGKIFPTAAAKERYEQVAAAEDPEAVVELQPWVSAGKAKDGSVGLFYKQGDERKTIAVVERSGVGAADDRGEYSGAASVDKLVAAGITSPPAHAHCRSQLVPASATPSRAQVPAKAPVGSPLLPSVQPYEGGPVPYGPRQVKPVVAPPASAFRPAPRAFPLDFNPETTPTLSAAEAAALQAEEAKRKTIADALAKLHSWPALGHPGFVAHDLPHVPIDATGALVQPYVTPTKVQLAGAKKQKPKIVAISDITLTSPAVSAALVEQHAKNWSITGNVVLVKSGGKLYALKQSEQQLVAAHLLGASHVTAQTIDLDKLAAKKPKAAPAPAPVSVPPPTLPSALMPPAPTPAAPGKKVDASVILHQQYGQQKGSNEGGFYRGSDGVERYVKFYDETGKAECEHLANAIYRDLGHVAPESVLFEHKGKTAFASVILQNAKTLRDVGHSADRSKKILEGFVADVLVANWDVVGVGNGGGDDNVVFLPDGKVARIDNGGSFLMKGLTGRKPSAALNAITEWEKFLDPSVNFNYARVAKGAGVTSAEDMKDVVVDGIQKVLALEKSAGGWSAYVSSRIPQLNGADRARIAEMLEARSRLLEQRLADLTKPAPAPGQPRFLAKQYSTVLPKSGLKLSDLPETTVIEDHYQKINRRYPKHMPSGERYADYKRRAEAAVKNIDGAALSGIQSFTGIGYDSIREDEERGKPDHRSDAIQAGLKKGVPEPGTVWRGIWNLPEAVIRKHLESGIIQLGKKGGATSSSAWCIDVSIDSFMGGSGDGHAHGGYKILYKLNGKTQVPIETISASGEGERELMFGREAAFRVTGLSRAKGRKHVLIVEAEELVGAERDAALGSTPPSAPTPAPKTPVSPAPKPSTPTPAPAAATSSAAKDEALMKLAVLPKTKDGKVVNPLVALGGPHFSDKAPPPVTSSAVPKDKATKTHLLPTTMVDPKDITMHSKDMQPALVQTLLAHDFDKTEPWVLIKAGGQLYMKEPLGDAFAATFHLLGEKMPAKVIDLDAAAGSATPAPLKKVAANPAHQKAFDAVAAMPVKGVGKWGPEVSHGLPTFGSGGPPTDPKTVSMDKVNAAKTKKPVLVSPSTLTLVSTALPAEDIEAMIPGAVDKTDSPLVLVKSGGKLYSKSPKVYDDVIAAYHAAETPLPAHIVNLDPPVSHGEIPKITTENKNDGYNKVKALTEVQPGKVPHPGANAHFSVSSPVPVAPSSVPAKDIEAIKKKQKPVLVDPSAITLLGTSTTKQDLNFFLDNVPEKMFPLVLLRSKSTGQIYPTKPIQDVIVGGLALLEQPVPAYLVDVD